MDELKFFVDVNLEDSFTKIIRNAGFDCKSISKIDCFMSDKEIVELGIKEKRIIVTEDKDFGERVFKDNIESFGIILIRVNSKDIESLEKRKKMFIKCLEFNSEYIINNFVVITETRIRINKL